MLKQFLFLTSPAHLLVHQALEDADPGAELGEGGALGALGGEEGSVARGQGDHGQLRGVGVEGDKNAFECDRKATKLCKSWTRKKTDDSYKALQVLDPGKHPPPW